MNQISGVIKVIQDTQQFASGFSKREFVITTLGDKYPQHLKFEILKDKCSLLDSYRVGQEVSVSFDIRGNEYQGKYYVSLVCWQLQSSSADRQPTSSDEPSANELRQEADFDDDIPF